MKTCTHSIATALLAAAATPLSAYAADTQLADAAPIIVAAAASPSAGPVTCAGDATLSPLQRRLLQRYDQSPQRLMQYVWITRSIYLLDRMETALWAESYRKTRPDC